MAISTQRQRAIDPLQFDCAVDATPANDSAAGRVLIVDDDPAVRLVCAVNLEAEGLQVLEAADGLDALEQARCERPDLILTDVAMPTLDGFQLAERLRQEQRTRGIPLIFLSGEGGAAHAERARTLGALAYLTKPFDPGALSTFVARELTAARVRPTDLTATVATSAVA